MPDSYKIKKNPLPRRVRTFLAKWGAILLATVVVAIIAGVGGTYLYAVSRVDSTLAWVTQNINLAQMGAAGTLENPPRAIYRVILQIDNPTPDDAITMISELYITLDEINIELEPVGFWTKVIHPTASADFEADMIISTDIMTILTQRQNVELVITGTVIANANYGVVHKELSRPILITTTAQFAVPAG